jgi:hypothetical protein
MPDDAIRPTLAYDNLPPGSDLALVHTKDNAVTITAPAGNPPAAMLRVVAQESAVFASLLGAGLVLGVIAFFRGAIHFDRLPAVLRVWGVVWFAVFCAGLFALLWRLRYAEMKRRLQRARLQSTIVYVSPGRLLIETTGPAGESSHDLPAGDIASITVDRGPRLARSATIVLRLKSGKVLKILRGRDERELRWAVETILGKLGNRV